MVYYVLYDVSSFIAITYFLINLKEMGVFYILPVSGLYDYYSEVVPKVMNGDMKLLDRAIADHSNGLHEFCCLRSR